MPIKIPKRVHRFHLCFGAVQLAGVVLSLFLAGEIFSKEIDSKSAQTAVNSTSVTPPARIIRAGLVEGYPPYSFVGDNGKPQGYAVDIANALARRMGFQLDITIGSRAEIYRAFQATHLDLLLWTPYLKSGDVALEPMPPYAVTSDFIFVREEVTEILEPGDLQNREVIVIDGDIAQYYLTRTKITDKIITAETPRQALEMLSFGTGDAVLLPGPTGLYISEKYELTKVKAITGPVTAYRRNFFFALPRGERELAAILSQGLDQLRESGELGLIYARWHDLPGWDAVSISRLIIYLLLTAVGISAVFASVFFWGMSQNRKAARRARELAREISERELAEAELKKHRHHLDQLVAEKTSHLESDTAFLKTELASLQTDTTLIRQESRTAQEFHRISGLGYWEYDIDRGLIRISEETFWMYGRPLKAGQPSFEEMNRYYHEESGRRFRAALKGAIEEGEPFALELEVVLPDGRRRRHYFKGHPVRGTAGRICLIRAVIQDVTARAEIEYDLRQALTETAEIVENINEAVITLDKQLTVTGINRAAERYFSDRHEKVMGRHFIDEAFPEFKNTEMEKQLRNVLDNQEIAPFEIAPGGPASRQWSEANIYPLNSGLAICISNISEKKRLEESLNESESRFQRLYHGVPHPAILTRYRDGVIVDINKSGESFFGLARQKIIGRTVLEMQLWNNQEERLHFLTDLRRKGNIEKREFAFNKPDGAAFIGRLSAVMIPLTGHWHVAAFLEDHTSAKSAETEFRQVRHILSNIMDFSPTIIFTTTVRGIIMSCNRNFESVLQKAGSEIMGKDISVLWPNWPSFRQVPGQDTPDNRRDFELVQSAGDESRTFWVRRIPLAEPFSDGPAYLVIADDISTRLKQIEITDNFAVRLTRAQAEVARLREQLEAIGKTQENDYLKPVICEEAGI